MENQYTVQENLKNQMGGKEMGSENRGRGERSLSCVSSFRVNTVTCLDYRYTQ